MLQEPGGAAGSTAGWEEWWAAVGERGHGHHPHLHGQPAEGKGLLLLLQLLWSQNRCPNQSGISLSTWLQRPTAYSLSQQGLGLC